MIEFICISSAVLLATLFILMGRKKEAAHQNAVTAAKSEIAGATKMTARIAVFADGRKTAGIMAVSEELHGFFYYKVVGALLTEKYSFSLDTVIQARLFINGHEVSIGSAPPEQAPAAFAQEVAAAQAGQYGASGLAAVRSINMEIGYAADGRPKALIANLLNNPDNEARAKMGKLVENAVWWTAFLRAASGAARRAAEERQEAMRLAAEGFAAEGQAPGPPESPPENSGEGAAKGASR